VLIMMNCLPDIGLSNFVRNVGILKPLRNRFTKMLLHSCFYNFQNAIKDIEQSFLVLAREKDIIDVRYDLLKKCFIDIREELQRQLKEKTIDKALARQIYATCKDFIFFQEKKMQDAFELLLKD